MQIEGYTPKQFVQDMLLSRLQAALMQLDQTGQIGAVELNKTQAKLVRIQLVSQHNKLLDKSGLDGTHIA